MNPYVLQFDEIDGDSLPDAGGKGANLGELTNAGFPVPPGFCVTTGSYRAFVETSTEMKGFFVQLNELTLDSLDQIRAVGERIRNHLRSLPIPSGVRAAITSAWRKKGTEGAYAVRSSATAEDLPTASFAGQQETYLNVLGEEDLMEAVRNCWASLFTDRAIVYRLKNGFDHRDVYVSVVVQQMVFPEVSGIMFTADPISGHRSTVSIDAGFGLGEAFVSGMVSADLYQVRSGQIVKKQIEEKKKAIYGLPGGGTEIRGLPREQWKQQALPDETILELARLGKRIEQHYGKEQDIEWGWGDGQLWILQSRPITTLYPIPDEVRDSEKLRVLFSFGHQQMMTEAMKPMALSIWRTVFPFGKERAESESRVLLPAGGRLFIDPTEVLYIKPVRRIMPRLLMGIDEGIARGVMEVIQRERFQQEARPRKDLRKQVGQRVKPIAVNVIKNLMCRDTSGAVEKCHRIMEEWVARSEEQLAGVTGAARIRLIRQNAGSLMMKLFTQMLPYPLSGVIAYKGIQDFTRRWLGENGDVHRLNRSLSGNVTSEMGLALGDLADQARKFPEVTEYLKMARNGTFYEGLSQVRGGEEFRIYLERFMDRYGMRCPGEIDISRTRWRESPQALAAAILGHIRNVEPGAHRLNFDRGRAEAEEAARRIVEEIRRRKSRWHARWMARLIRVFRDVMGVREHPKYILVRHLDLWKRGILEEAETLAARGILEEKNDVFHLTLDELAAILDERFPEDVRELIGKRKRDYVRNQTLSPPRVMTHEGEIMRGVKREMEIPEDSLLGTPVSAGVVEGVARVVMDPEQANLQPGDILIAPFTDPGWTPLFHSAQALVMEVGGLMTHGAVVAREYGIPAVVGVDGATRHIKDGQRLRIDGTQGIVTVLSEEE